MAELKVLILVILLLGVVEVKGKCVTLPHCTCQEGAKNEDREFKCGTNPKTGIISQIKPEVNLIVQCNFNTTSSDLDMLKGMKVGPVQTIQFTYCPLPLIPLGELTEHIIGNTLNSTKTLIFQSHRTIGNTLNKKHFKKLFNVVKLELSSNELTELPEDLLEFMPSLTTLDMRDNSLQYLPPGLLWSTPKLQELTLENNLLTQYPENFFLHLTSLKLLNLRRNNLLTLKSTTFASLTSLETLDLHSNRLKTLPHDIFYNLTKLSDLNLSSNNFTSLPEGLFKETKKLIRLELSENHVSSNIELPDGIFSDLPKLKKINISSSGISKLPSNFIKGSIGLISLIVIDNNIATIPGGLFQEAVNLTILDLSNNKLQTLSKDTFVGLNNVKTLRLGRNKLEILSNQIFSSLEKLEELDLSNNEITTVESEVFQKLPTLRLLRLDNNKLKFNDGPNDFFGSYSPLYLCVQLEELSIANNSINEVFADWRISMLNLRKLDLKYNNFTRLTMEHLHFLSTNLTIDLRHNYISEIIFQNVESLALQLEIQDHEPHHTRSLEVLLANNTINCDSCFTFDLLRYQENRMNPAIRRLFNISTEGVQCDSKSSLSGKLLKQISSDNFTCKIQEQICPIGCECNLRLSDKAIILKCCKQLKSFPRFSNFFNRTEYSLTNCGIKVAPNTFQIKNHDKISGLYLSNNNISMFRVCNLPDTIDILELHNNNISSLSKEVVMNLRENAFIRRLTLSGNPWKCDCKVKDLLAYVQENVKVVPDLVNMTCVDGRQFSQLTTSDLCDGNAKTAVGASIAIAMTGILIGAAIALYYRYQARFKILFH